MQLLVQNEDKLVYEVEMKVQQASEFYYHLELNLIGGWDYVSEESDRQGYVGAKNFFDHVQYESLTFYPMHETITSRLEEEGFKVVKTKNLALENFIASL